MYTGWHDKVAKDIVLKEVGVSVGEAGRVEVVTGVEPSQMDLRAFFTRSALVSLHSTDTQFEMKLSALPQLQRQSESPI